MKEAIEKGKIIQVYIQSSIEKLALRAVEKKFHGKRVLVVNSSQWHSELGNYLVTHNDCDVAMIMSYDFRDKSYHISLRCVQILT